MPSKRWVRVEGEWRYPGLPPITTDPPLEPFVMDETKPTPLNTPGPDPTVTLTTVNAPYSITGPGVYSGLRIKGKLSISSATTGLIHVKDLVVDMSEVSISGQGFCVQISMNCAADVLIERVEIIGQAGLIGVGPRRFTLLRSYIHHVEDAYRLHNSGAAADSRQQELDVEIAGNMLGPLITRTPDPYMVRSDNRTHSDIGQIEGGNGAYIHGNTHYAYNTTDGTSNLEWVIDGNPVTPVPAGTSGGQPHPQALSCLLINPGVSNITNFLITKNWFEGGAYPINAGASGQSATSGEISFNRFDRGSFYPTNQILVHSSAVNVHKIANVYEDNGEYVEPFVSNVTTPYYEPTVDHTGWKNVGNLPGVTRTDYGSTVVNGVTQLSGSSYSNLNFSETISDIRASATFNNCRFEMSGNDYTLSDSIRAMVRVLNGSPALVTFNDCEFHYRGQRVLTVVTGRNIVMNRCVITGGVDGPSDSTAGSAPQNFGIRRYDCWIGGASWWRTPALPWEGHPSDDQTHNDGSQVATTLGNEWHNCVIVEYASPWTGTGTTGSGSDAGNSYVPATGSNYISTQENMEAWRETYLDWTSTASQSYRGIQRQMSTGGSWACIMANRNGGVVEDCIFSGGTVGINIMDTNVTGSWSIKRNVFYNDMVNGPVGRASNPATKGYAIQIRSGLNGVLDIPTSGADRNLWFDGTTVTPTYV